VPIHSIIGDRDLVTPRYQTRYGDWRHYADSVRLHVLKDARHYFLRTNAGELAEILTRQE